METDVPSVAADLTVGELAARLARGEEPLAEHRGHPIVDSRGRLAGLITRGDVLKSLREDPSGSSTVLRAGTHHPILAYPDELVVDAAHRMLQNDVGRLVVVSREDSGRLLGYLGRTGILKARQRYIQEEEVRGRVLFLYRRDPPPHTTAGVAPDAPGETPGG
jgi:CBS domain-containing protein